MKFFNPKNWYWIVGGDQTRAFSSAAGDYVAASDATFAAWKADGTLPTVVDTEANLGSVLAPYGLRPVNAAVLDGFQNALATSIPPMVVFKVLFNHESRIRVLEGKTAITPAQFTVAIKALI